ncbi:hypothetical protein MVEN_02394500 [Mycena venus]|uniref:Uncharacterized protein n=1 Tax=Mycena venus TaxID=2733690 RepID=A0A8H7CDT7_9AGAR|nr:hypothetical protein MVEN_02394500 [Mycena venus]
MSSSPGGFASSGADCGSGYGFPAPPLPSQQRDFGTELSNTPDSQGNRHHSTFDGSSPVNPNTQAITKFAPVLGLNAPQRKGLHEFDSLPVDVECKIALAYAQTMLLDQRLDNIETQLDKVFAVLTVLQQATAGGWSLSSEQMTALKDLSKHQMVSPTLSVEVKHLVLTAMNYVAQHRQKYRLEAFTTDAIVKASIKKFLTDNMSITKSKFRKRLFKLTSLPLDELAPILISEYLLNGSKSTFIKSDALAHIALLRSKAAPLAAVALTRKAVKGVDTGFWKDVNDKLKNIARMHGTNREAAGWKEWEEAIIRADREKYVPSTASVDVNEDSESDESDEDEGLNSRLLVWKPKPRSRLRLPLQRPSLPYSLMPCFQ